MSRTPKPARALLLSLAMIGTLLTIGASSAAAAPATWSATGPLSVRGPLTLTRPAISTTINCDMMLSIGASAGSSTFSGTPSPSPCGTPYNGSFTMMPHGSAQLNAGNYSLSFNSIVQQYFGSLGYYVPGAFTVPFTNGSGSTPSRVTFNNTHIGSGIYATGTLNVTKMSPPGSLVTLN